MARVPVTLDISIDERELVERFVLASGPGGQNVNKVASAVELTFDAARSPALGDEVRARLIKLAGARASKGGIIRILARRFRAQDRNRADARERLIELIIRAATPPKPRRKTRVPKAAKVKRREVKRLRGDLKKFRGRPREE